jgi:hypothetical protein
MTHTISTVARVLGTAEDGVDTGKGSDCAHRASDKVPLGLRELATFEADSETEKMLLEAIAPCQRGETTPLSDFLAELRGRE